MCTELYSPTRPVLRLLNAIMGLGKDTYSSILIFTISLTTFFFKEVNGRNFILVVFLDPSKISDTIDYCCSIAEILYFGILETYRGVLTATSENGSSLSLSVMLVQVEYLRDVCWVPGSSLYAGSLAFPAI